MWKRCLLNILKRWNDSPNHSALASLYSNILKDWYVLSLRILPIILQVFLVIIIPSNLNAETEIQGEMSGVLTVEDSPYLITATILVPYGDTLSVEPGVYIRFVHNTEINVNGTFLALGTEEDTIVFAGEERNDKPKFEPINPGQDTSIALSYCLFPDGIKIRSGEVLTQLTFRNSTVRGYVSIQARNLLRIYLSSINFETNDINLSALDWGYLELKNCIALTYGSSSVTFSEEATAIIDSCTLPYFTMSGDFLSSGGEIIVRNSRFNFMRASGLTTVLQCTLGAFSGTGNIDIRDNIFTGYMNLYGDTVRIRSGANGGNVRLTLENNINIQGLRVGYLDNESSVKNNVIYGRVVLDSCRTPFENNTVIIPNEEIREAIYCENYGRPIVRNSIIVGYHPETTLYGISCSDFSPPDDCFFSWNNFWQVGEPYDSLLDGSNELIADPRFIGGNPFDYNLQAISPCIDAGDFYPPRDPDDTRSDMGALYFNQLFNHPPFIPPPHQVFAMRGEFFRYAVYANDDGDAVRISFLEYPDWLIVDEPDGEIDTIEDSLIISGRMPAGTDDFMLLVRADDQNEQSTTQPIYVTVIGSVIEGEINGRLTARDSPYRVTGDLHVPEGDTLTIDPGVTFLFNPVMNPQGRIGLNIEGALLAQGTEEDSIIFKSLSFEPGGVEWHGITITNQDSIYLSYVSIENAFYGIRADSFSYFRLSDSKIANSEYALYKLSGNKATFRDCNFARLYSGSYTYENRNYYCPDTLKFFRNEFKYISEHAIKQKGYIVLQGNTISNCFYGLKHDGPGTGDISENWFEYNNQAIDLKSRADYVYWISIHNNVFIDNRFVVFFEGANANFYNNTCIGYNSGIALFMDFGTDSCEVYNNIFYDISSIRLEGIPYENDWVFAHHNNQWPFAYYEDSVNVGEGNINEDPLFVDLSIKDFRLRTGSPCIDTGDPDSALDPDSSRADMGAFTYDLDWNKVNEIALPSHDELFQNYPNPFNNITTVSFMLGKPAKVKLEMFNIIGQKVSTISHANLLTGFHSITWKGISNNNVPVGSGLYFIRLEISRTETEDIYYTTKALLIK
ncbi:MAG: NosD domain-containing protein [Candidatus Electryonea clarkiae]|nr:NosD domain-containing protein [Candidatus Electryonea clarkiae]MDP8286685.1 NosD domain-containing protein [Candidatus Electryonea clarkiae]